MSTSSLTSPSKSPRSKHSVRFTIPAPTPPLQSPVKHPPPTVKFEVPHTRDYLKLLHQTKVVYDQLLAAKQARLVEDLYRHKQDLDQQCGLLSQSDQQKAMEFGVSAQETLNKLQSKAEEELTSLHADYQGKLNKMRDSLEEKWLSEHAGQGAGYTYYPHRK